MGEITRLLKNIKEGQPGAEEALVELTYDELRRMAARMMSGEAPGHTLQATALVNQAWLRITDDDGNLGGWNSRAHYFSALGEAMRRILIESARRRNALKRGGGAKHTQLNESMVMASTTDDELLKINESLSRLEAEDQQAAAVVKGKYHMDMTNAQVAEQLGVSERTVNRLWDFAKAWIWKDMTDPD